VQAFGMAAALENVMDGQGRIAVVGSANMDIVLPVSRLPRAGETLPGGDMAVFPGGKGANQACAAARLGGAVYFVGQVGCDAFGGSLRDSLQQAGVDTSPLGVGDRPTGCACIYVLPGGENAIVISPGANATLDPQTAISRLSDLPRLDFVLLQLEIPMETVEAVLRWARARGATTILDPAPARPLPDGLMRYVDYLTPNQSEAASLLREPALEIREFEDAEEAATRLLAMGPSGVLVKLGAHGSVLVSGFTHARILGFPVHAVDTTAAGDAFNGALAVAMAEGQTIAQAAVFASAAGAVTVMRHGAQSSLPRRHEVDALLETGTTV
jgi:ribokinase